MPETKTVRVRIAVAVGKFGEWSAHGDSDVTDEYAADQASEVFLDAATIGIVFIEADVPIPQPQTIEGTVAP